MDQTDIGRIDNMKKELFWQPLGNNLSDAIDKEISKNVEEAYKHIFKTGVLWLGVDEGKVTLKFTDENYEFSKSFSIPAVKLASGEDEDDSKAIVKALESLSKRMRKKIEARSTLYQSIRCTHES